MYTRIISAFPACGKTFLHNKAGKGYTTLDSDSSKFSWVLDREGQPTSIRNTDFPNNYITYIKSNIGKVDYIFVSSHKEVRLALEAAGLRYATVQPDTSLKAEWLGRCWLRNNADQFLRVLNQNWDVWTNLIDIQQDYDNIASVVLKSGEHLEDHMWFLETVIGNRKEATSGSDYFICSMFKGSH